MEQGSSAGRRMLAFTLPVLAFVLQWLFWEVLKPYVWLFFYPAVYFSSWLGGVAVGLAATVVSALSVWFFFMPPRFSFALERPSSALAIAIFCGMGILISLFHKRLKESRQTTSQVLAELTSAKDHLEERIAERTRELQRTVEELKGREGELHKAQELARIGSWSYTLDGRLTWSEQLYRIYGMQPGEFTPGREIFLDLIHPQDRDAMQTWIEECLNGRQPGEIQFRVVHPDGTLRHISGRGELIRDDRGKPTGMSGTAQDVTGRVEAEAARRESEERLRYFIQYAPVPLAMFDREMRYLFASRRWCSDYGLEGGDLTGKSHYDLFPELPERWKEFHRRGMAGETLSAEADTFVRKDGTVQWLRWELHPWYGKHGEVGGIVIFSEDVTERIVAQEALQKLNEELEARVAQRTRALDDLLATQDAQHAELQEAYRELEVETADRIRILTELRKKDQVLIHQSRLAAMGELLGYIAHQWRQPLNLLGLNIQELRLSFQHGTFTPELLEGNTGKAMEIIRHLSRTIDDFRDFLVVNKERTVFRVDEVIRKTVGMIRENLEKVGIAVSIATDGTVEASGFPNEFGHVILNLLTNARDAFVERRIPDPRVAISTRVEGKDVVVTVADNAGGIGEEILDKIFDAYFTTKELGKGSGVGLFMSKMIIEKNMGGRLSVRNLDGGAEFTIRVTGAFPGKE